MVGAGVAVVIIVVMVVVVVVEVVVVVVVVVTRVVLIVVFFRRLYNALVDLWLSVALSAWSVSMARLCLRATTSSSCTFSCFLHSLTKGDGVVAVAVETSWFDETS